MQASLNLSLWFFGLYIMSIMVALRVFRKTSPTVLVCAAALIVYFSSLALLVSLGQPFHFFSFSSLYWFLTLSLLMFFGATYKSISLKMMLHLLNQPQKTASYEVILEKYIKDQSYRNRIQILLDKKLIEKKDNTSFNLTKKGRLFARKLKIIQSLFSIKESG